ncbi:MAG: ATP-binding cassette domain-containing protein [Oscillospiraceae bacterium]|jgi:Fe-S cluster assembly ATP-binding protein|nr:ATP-binding cassette domain-containing protein [Oscillospiraceae bacterium]
MLELKNVSFEVKGESRDGKKEILRDVSLTVEDGSFVVITGPNGGGKSTLARLIMGIEIPASGSIIFDGKDITGLSITERAALGIGFAFQQPVRFKGLTVRDILTLAAGRELTFDEACGYLVEVGLCAADYVDRELNSSFSGGELKRVEIAMVIARGTRLSVFDEPEAGIDLWSFHNLIRVFESMRDATKGAIIIISHQERILEIANKVVVIANGRLDAVGTREEILPELFCDAKTCRYYRGAV